MRSRTKMSALASRSAPCSRVERHRVQNPSSLIHGMCRHDDYGLRSPAGPVRLARSQTAVMQGHIGRPRRYEGRASKISHCRIRTLPVVLERLLVLDFGRVIDKAHLDLRRYTGGLLIRHPIQRPFADHDNFTYPSARTAEIRPYF